MWGVYLLTILAFTALKVVESEQCPVSFQPIGCYKDRRNNRALPNQLLNGRDRSSLAYDGIYIDFENFENYLPDFACRCAQAAVNKSNKIFGLQFYAECWSGPSPAANDDYDKHGAVSTCVHTDYNQCAPNTSYCVGKANTNYVYEIVSKPLPCDSSPCQNGGKCTNQVDSFSCECSEHFGGDNCSVATCTGDKMDILYIVDSSGSVLYRNFQTIKQFIMDLNTRFSIGPDDTRVALAEFGKEKDYDTYISLDSTKYNRNLEILNKEISYLSYLNSDGTATGHALNKAKEVFSPSVGDRSGIPDVLILITDGKASDHNQFSEAQDLKNHGVTIITVGVGHPEIVAKFSNDLKNLASDYPGRHRKLSFEAEYEDLHAIANALVEVMCIQNRGASTDQHV